MKPPTSEVIHQRAALDAREQQQLTAAEADVERGGKLIVTAMQLIRDNRLYRASHDTFEDYCRERWERTARDVNRLIQTEQVIQSISAMGPIGPKISHAAAREVADLPVDQAAEIVKKAAETNGKPTAKAVKEVRDQVAPKKISGGTSFNVGELEGGTSIIVEGKDYSVEKKKASDAVGAAIRRLDDLNRVNRKNALHQKAMDGLHAAFEEVQKW